MVVQASLIWNQDTDPFARIASLRTICVTAWVVTAWGRFELATLLRILGIGVRWAVNFFLLLLALSAFLLGGDLGYGSDLETGLKFLSIFLAFFLLWLVERQAVYRKPKTKLSLRSVLKAIPLFLLVMVLGLFLGALRLTLPLGVVLLLVFAASIYLPHLESV